MRGNGNGVGFNRGYRACSIVSVVCAHRPLRQAEGGAHRRRASLARLTSIEDQTEEPKCRDGVIERASCPKTGTHPRIKSEDMFFRRRALRLMRRQRCLENVVSTAWAWWRIASSLASHTSKPSVA